MDVILRRPILQRYVQRRREKRTPVIPFFLRNSSPLSKHLGYALYTPRSHYRGREGKEGRRERRERRVEGARGRVAKKGGERKREFSRPSFAFYPPRSGSKSREPLSHRLLDACKYPWQRGTTMRGDPRRELFLRISGWVRKVFQRYRGGRRGKRKLEPLGKISFWSATYSSHFLIPSLCLANSPPLEQTEDCCSKQ